MPHLVDICFCAVPPTRLYRVDAEINVGTVRIGCPQIRLVIRGADGSRLSKLLPDSRLAVIALDQRNAKPIVGLIVSTNVANGNLESVGEVHKSIKRQDGDKAPAFRSYDRARRSPPLLKHNSPPAIRPRSVSPRPLCRW